MKRSSKSILLSMTRTLSVTVLAGLLIVLGYFVVEEMQEKDRRIEQLQERAVQNFKDISIMTNAYTTIRKDNESLMRNIDFWKRQCEMLMRENHELKGIPTSKIDLPKPPAPPPKGTNDVAVVKADNKMKENGKEEQKQVPGRLYDKNGKEYIIKNGKKVYIVRKKVPAKPKEPPKEPQK